MGGPKPVFNSPMVVVMANGNISHKYGRFS